jgi:hypothetical protein
MDSMLNAMEHMWSRERVLTAYLAARKKCSEDNISGLLAMHDFYYSIKMEIFSDLILPAE